MIYVKSFLTGLAALCAAVFLAGIVLIARVWMWDGFMAVEGCRIAGPVLVASFLVFAVGFSWQCVRLLRKGSFAQQSGLGNRGRRIAYKSANRCKWNLRLPTADGLLDAFAQGAPRSLKFTSTFGEKNYHNGGSHVLTIRKEQMAILETAAQERFVERMVRHLFAFWQERCEREGRGRIRESVQQGITRAESFGIRTEYDTARFIDVMYLLSVDFDTNTEFRWAHRILHNPAMAPRAKMDRICARVSTTVAWPASESGIR